MVNVEKSKGEFKGATEVDEAYVGGKEGNMHKHKKADAKKVVIIGMINLAGIPFEQIMSQKLKNKKTNFLPYIIDYACGSGHFLTEGMDEVIILLKN